MIARATRAAAVLAHAFSLALVLATAGCHDLELVGTFAGGTSGGDDGGEAAPGADAGPIVTIDDCQAGSNDSGLDAETVGRLLQGAEGGVQWLYPYDGTVFPGGIAAPLLMWSDGASADDAVLLHMHSASFDYRGCMKPTAAGQLQIPQEVWAIAGAGTAGAAQPFSLELTVLAGGRALGSPAEDVVIATGTLPGSVYYMTLGSKMGIGIGSVIQVQTGQPGQLILGGIGCVGCHSVSAYGSRLIAYSNGLGTAFGLQSPPSPNGPMQLNAAPGGEGPGITPDGTLYVASAHPTGVGPKSYGAGVMTAGLYETSSGNLVSGSGVPGGAMTPAFSPDGARLVFNDDAIDDGHGLALMDFSESTRTASNYTTLLSGTTNYPAWPSFLPDGNALVFQFGVSSDFTGGGTGLSGGTTPGPAGDLYLVDLATRTPVLLAEAMGFANQGRVASGTTYLPFGASELHQNYGPSVVPSMSGGYAWVFFDSMRHYGNQGSLRQIWGAAIDVAPDGSYAVDPSHPAFFLPGQEIGTGNFRAIAALDP